MRARRTPPATPSQACPQIKEDGWPRQLTGSEEQERQCQTEAKEAWRENVGTEEGEKGKYVYQDPWMWIRS